ncbi:MAG: FAD binding domain-containing protein [Planctomycetes bacterium]|jgi:probable selenate reductase FAD-binding subunit|nr:FAD binding domain-containing protein [Planctomycetota bacterium]HNZ66289.1 FAD binding domain-containing protein [Planctomycetota bacterium]HPY74539.1 FAD binding domain-containing protein [Planctomycetota bacterium]HQB00183.1 FAD binding domain-containing protein [Planctomycetota bacterium]
MIQDYVCPNTIQDAIHLKNQYKEKGCYLAGGTQCSTYPSPLTEVMISLEKLGLDQIVIHEKEVQVGAMVTCTQIINFPFPPETHMEGFKNSTKRINNPQIRNMATIGGNIAANKSSSGFIPVLLAYHASMQIVLSDGNEKIISLEEYVQQKQDDFIKTILIPIPSNNFHINHKKYQRSSQDIGIINVVVSFDIIDETIENMVIAIGGIAETVKRLSVVEEKLNHKKIADFSITECEKWVEENVHPVSDIRASAEYKTHLCKVYVADAIQECIQ